MKKAILSLLLGAALTGAQAQDYGKITLLTTTNKWDDALKELARLEADKKGSVNPETIAWRAYIYGELMLDSTQKAKYPNAEQEVLTTVKKLQTADPSGKLMKERGVRPSYIVYSNRFNNGLARFKEKNWKAAFEEFKVAEEIGDFLSKGGFTTTKQNLDTISATYAGYSAQNAQLPEEAAKYYSKIINEGIATEEYADAYKYVVDFYNKRNDAENAAKYLALARKAYPAQAALWNEFELEGKTKNASLQDLLSQYKSGVEAMSNDQLVYYADAFGNPDKEKLAKVDSSTRMDIRKASADAFGRAYNKEKNGLYAYNAGVLNFQTFNDLLDRFYEYKGESAALKAKRASIEKEMHVVADESIKWLELAYTDLKAKTDRKRNETQSLGNSIKDLTVLFSWKRDRARGKDPKAFDAAEAKYKVYDAEYGKY